MKIGDLVKMDFEGTDGWQVSGDAWGIGIIVTVEYRTPDNVEVLWPNGDLSWEMKIMLDIIDENR